MKGNNVTMTDEPQTWQARANCTGVDPELFFPERGASTFEAKQACQSCAARDDCLQDALERGEKFGIWGGLSERQRRRIRTRTPRGERITVVHGDPQVVDSGCGCPSCTAAR